MNVAFTERLGPIFVHYVGNKKESDMNMFSKITKAAVVALTLGATALPAMPVQAQDVDLKFRFNGPGFSLGFGDFDRRRCLTDPQVRRDLRRGGYDEIRFIDRSGRIVQVIAERGRRDYIIAYDTCRQRIVDRERIRRR
jgi:hypothetical protein